MTPRRSVALSAAGRSPTSSWAGSAGRQRVTDRGHAEVHAEQLRQVQLEAGLLRPGNIRWQRVPVSTPLRRWPASQGLDLECRGSHGVETLPLDCLKAGNVSERFTRSISSTRGCVGTPLRHASQGKGSTFALPREPRPARRVRDRSASPRSSGRSSRRRPRPKGCRFTPRCGRRSSSGRSARRRIQVTANGGTPWPGLQDTVVSRARGDRTSKVANCDLRRCQRLEPGSSPGATTCLVASCGHKL